ncbi:DUF6332 family protein [Streptomyces justiciae]|uniref:DUF6332 family protein n=1 Tax=Streptomyces justiciae TaxID=2780140 RepID=UPI00389AF65C
MPFLSAGRLFGVRPAEPACSAGRTPGRNRRCSSSCVGLGIAPVLFVARVISVLVRFRQDDAQPSQPGRTNPDS